MIKRNYLWAAALLLGLASCESQEVQNVSESNDDLLAVQIEAAISSGSAARSESEVGKTAFADADELGLFAFGNTSVSKWTYSSSTWSAESTLYWPTKSTEYTFYAFYPYDENATLTSVPMPDLTAQDGTFSESNDFIVASKTCSYNSTTDGLVSFSGDDAFKHVYSMLTLAFTNGVDESLTLSSVTASLEGMMTQCYYNFENGASEESETAVDGITFSGLSQVIESDGTYSLVFLTNAVATSGNLTITIVYTRDTTTYTATAEVSITGLEASTHYTLSLNIAKNKLTLEVIDIEDWVDSDMDDVTLTEEVSE